VRKPAEKKIEKKKSRRPTEICIHYLFQSLRPGSAIHFREEERGGSQAHGRSLKCWRASAEADKRSPTVILPSFFLFFLFFLFHLPFFYLSLSLFVVSQLTKRWEKREEPFKRRWFDRWVFTRSTHLAANGPFFGAFETRDRLAFGPCDFLFVGGVGVEFVSVLSYPQISARLNVSDSEWSRESRVENGSVVAPASASTALVYFW